MCEKILSSGVEARYIVAGGLATWTRSNAYYLGKLDSR